jgi:glycosyltransferase involved in cell wall biosynthesis
MPTLAIIPSEPIAEYEQAGYASWLEGYYNPAGLFSKVYVVSPLERRARSVYGLEIAPVPWWKVRSALGRVQPDVIRAYGGYWAMDLACAVRLPGVPVVVSLHDTAAETLHRTVREADRVWCVSGAVRAMALAAGIPDAVTRLLPNRVDRRRFNPEVPAERVRAVRDRFPAGRMVLHVGRKTHQKNPETLIDALRHLPAEYFAVFVGRGDDRTYRTRAAQTGVGARCYWVEAVENAELPAWFLACDCMCTPSRHEGFGIVFIEAAACGAAIVTCDLAPMNEYLAHGRSAHLVGDADDPAGLAAALRVVCENTGYRTVLKRGALAAAEPFDQEAISRLESGLYTEVLDLRRRGEVRRRSAGTALRNLGCAVHFYRNVWR